MIVTPEIRVEFERRVVRGSPDECWHGGRFSMSQKGYRNLHITGSDGRLHTSASRVSFAIHNGPLESSEQVRHTCSGTGWCLNPRHLKKGRARDNLLDCIAAGRRRIAPRKYTEQQALDARRLYRDGGTVGSIAKAVGAAWSWVDDVVHGRAWAHLGGKIVRRTEYETDADGRKRARYVLVEELPPKPALPADYDYIGVDTSSSLLPAMADNIVADLKLFRRQGMHVARVARMFCITPATVRKIDKGDLYGHVPGPAPSRTGPLAAPRGPISPRKPRTNGAKLNAEVVRKIKAERAEGVPRRIVAGRHGVAIRTISEIDKGRSWAHVAGPSPAPHTPPPALEHIIERGPLDLATAVAIKRDLSAGMNVGEAARKHQRACSTVRDIARGTSWGWIDPAADLADIKHLARARAAGPQGEDGS